MTTVVIVPLIAVMDDLRDRCVKANISCANWDPHSRYSERCDLLFVTVEHAVEPAFRNHLQIMHGMGILKRIVMDEAHVLTHRDFSLDMEKLVIVMRMVPVQVLLLTATMPPSMEQDLRITLACSIWEVIRAETTRPEIGYEIVEANEEEEELDIKIAFRIKKEMRKWSRGRNGELNGNWSWDRLLSCSFRHSSRTESKFEGDIEMEESEMDVDECSRSIIDGFKENMMMADGYGNKK